MLTYKRRISSWTAASTFKYSTSLPPFSADRTWMSLPNEFSSALIDLASLSLDRGEALPIPDPSLTGPDSDLEEPLHLPL